MNEIPKDCPKPTCNSKRMDILGALLVKEKSFNLYKCPKCKQQITLERTSLEQKLTQKYIDASKIILKT